MVWVKFLIPDNDADQLFHLAIIPQKGSKVRLTVAQEPRRYRITDVCHTLESFGKHSVEIELEHIEV